MAWDLQEAVRYYMGQGAPGDQNALTSLLREIQDEFGGIPRDMLGPLAETLGVKESFLLALIRRQPRLRLSDTHRLELCAGPNCGKRTALTALAETLCRGRTDITVKYVPCMRRCAEGPNLRWDGVLYSRADEKLLRELMENE